MKNKKEKPQRDETIVELNDGTKHKKYTLWCMYCFFHHHPEKDCGDKTGWIKVN